MVPESTAVQPSTLDYDVVVHEVMDRLTQLAALTAGVERTRGEVSAAFALIGDLAPLLSTIIGNAEAVGTQIAEWRTATDAETKRAFEGEATRVERLIAEVDTRLRAYHVEAKASLAEQLTRLERGSSEWSRAARELETVLAARSAEIIPAIEAQSRAARETAKSIGERLDRLDGSVEQGTEATRKLALASDARSDEVTAAIEQQSRYVLDGTTRSADDVVSRLNDSGEVRSAAVISTVEAQGRTVLDATARSADVVVSRLSDSVEVNRAAVISSVAAQGRTVLDATMHGANDIAVRVDDLGATLGKRIDELSLRANRASLAMRRLTIGLYVLGLLTVGGLAVFALGVSKTLGRLSPAAEGRR